MRAASQQIAWDGPPLQGSEIVPEAVRGTVRADDHRWVWYFTHDGRVLLMSYPVGEADRVGVPFGEQRALFAGMPDDLLSLVVDRDAGGLYPTVAGDPDPAAPGLLASATVLPAVEALFWHDGYDWQSTEGLRRRAYAALSADAEPSSVRTGDMLGQLWSTTHGLPPLQWVLRAGRDRLTPYELSDERYCRVVFDRSVTPGEAKRAVAAPGDCHALALTGSLNALLDAIADTPGSRYLLDAALGNPDPVHRRQIALTLLDRDVDASIQLSPLTPVNVLFANPTLGADDAPVLRRLLQSGAATDAGLMGAEFGLDPLAQLVERDPTGVELAALYAELTRAREAVAADADPAP